MGIIKHATDISAIQLKESAAPATPDSGYLRVFAKTDGKMYSLNDAGTEVELANATHEHAASDITSGTLVHERGGLEADVSAYAGLVKISGGSTSQAVAGTDYVSPTGEETVSNKVLDNVDGIILDTSTELTISGGSISITKSYHTVDTEGDGASDDLDTIAGSHIRRLFVLQAENDARTVVLKHGTGNIYMNSGADFSLDTVNKIALCFSDGSNIIVIT